MARRGKYPRSKLRTYSIQTWPTTSRDLRSGGKTRKLFSGRSVKQRGVRGMRVNSRRTRSGRVTF